MFQLINGTIECGECRNEILHGEEFNCPFCDVSLCDSERGDLSQLMQDDDGRMCPRLIVL
jgi:hypothetical protein